MSKRWHSVPLRAHRAPQPIRTTHAHPAQADEDEDAIIGHMGDGARPQWAEQEQEQDRRPLPASSARARTRTTDSADLLYTGRPPLGSVTRRYTDQHGNTVIEQGRQRYVLHTEQGWRVTEQGPGRPRPRKARRRVSGLFVFGLGMLVMVVLLTLVVAIYQHQQAAEEQAAFEQPIITEQFQVVGHNHDSVARPSYFEFINLQGRVLIIELPAGDPAKAMIYTGPQILGQSAYNQQITGEFRDINGDGRIDLIVSIGGQQITFLNNGTKFVPQQ
jgi:hypothetical protein